MPTKAAQPKKKNKSRSEQREFGKAISVATAAERAGTSPRSIHRLRGQFMYRKYGNAIVISEPSFEAFLERHTYRPVVR